MKTFGWTRPVRDEDGNVIGSKPSPVKVRTLEALGAHYLADRGKRLVFTMHPQDVIGVRPERTGRELCITATDLYGYLVRMSANRAHLEKARARKTAKAARLARARQQRAEKKLIHRNP